jgi:hypothetical protein
MFIPQWFKNELKIIDPRYYITIDKNWYQIRYDKTVPSEDDEGKPCMRMESFILAEYRDLDYRAIGDMKFRKWLGRHYEVPDKPEAWMEKMYKRPSIERKQKERKEASEQVAEGLMKAHEFEKRKYFT